MVAARSIAGTLAGLAVVFVTALPSQAIAESRGDRRRADQWTFLDAWSTFRGDLDATLPGEHGEVLLIERLHGLPPWLLRTGLRLATNPEVIKILARRAARQGDAKAVPALRRALEGTPNAACKHVVERAMVRLGDDAMISTLAKRLSQGTPQSRRETATTLGAAGPKATPILTSALESTDLQTRLAAASTLASQGSRPAQKLLGTMLSSPNEYARVEAAHALALAGDQRAIPPLREKLARQGADRLRVIRSLGLVGGSEERDLLVKTLSSLPRGRAKAARREILLALGRIATRTKLTTLESHLAALDEGVDDVAGVSSAWLEAIGWADLRGARSQAAYVSKIRESIESPFPGETPMAHELRQQRVSRLLVVLTGAPNPGDGSVGAGKAVPRATLEQWLAVRNPEEATERMQRFRAAVLLLTQLGEALGYDQRSDPPEATAVGLGAERALDGNLLTAWIAGSMAGPLRLDLPAARTLKALYVVNGCVDSRESFSRHARVKTLSIALGERTVTATLSDQTPALQRVALPPVATKRLILEVSSTYPGDRPEAPACIAEVRLE